jgi:hypothetical protein
VKRQLVATLIEVRYPGGANGGRVHHVYTNSAGTHLKCACTGNTPQAVPYTQDLPVSFVDAPRVCQHIKALYIENPSGFAQVNFTEVGRLMFHSIWAARALTK